MEDIVARNGITPHLEDWPIPFLTGLGYTPDTAVGSDHGEGIPGWETRTG